MKTIKQFIDLGWYTVPLKGQLKRLSTGKKTLPEFEKNWKDKYTKQFNENATALGGALTGKQSGIIAIDCDNAVTYEIFKLIDPDYNFIFVSKGKQDELGNEINAGTFIYNYVDELDETYSVHNNQFSLDFYSNGGFIYLPSDSNQTKEPFELTELKDPPANLIALIKSLKPVRVVQADEALRTKTWTNHLAPQMLRFVSTKKVTKELFKILTPRDFRDLSEYIDNGFLHPKDIPNGRGSEYLSKVSSILGADESIDEELYMASMSIINDCFIEPMPRVRLSSTVIEPMVEERASIDGVPIWRYNEDWEVDKLTIVTKRNNVVEGFFDPERVRYYIADIGTQSVKSFFRDSDFFSYLEAVAVEPPSKKEAKNKMPLVNVVSSPAYDFGFFHADGEDTFNAFSPSVPLTIFKSPSIYTKDYVRPNTILRYLESLIPDNYMRNYLLRFMRRKLDKFEYSPTILYMLGVSGAGKDTFVHIIEALVGAPSIARPTTKEFLEIYNGWMLDKYFAQLDEYGNQLSRFDEKESALGKIKAYTGKAEVQIRSMRTDGFNYSHAITFIMTANKNPLFLDHDDRRVALFNCPNALKDEPWIIELGGVGNVHNQIFKEINDFAYYLSTEVDNLTLDEYMSPPETEDKKALIASKFNASMKIAFYLSNRMFKELEEIAREFDCQSLFDGADSGRMYEEELFDLYYEMTDGKGTKRGLNSAMKEFDKIPTTRNGIKAYYYNVPALRGYNLSAFAPIDGEVVDLKEK